MNYPDQLDIDSAYDAYSNGEITYTELRKRLHPEIAIRVVLRSYERGRQERVERVLKFAEEQTHKQ